MTDPVVSVVMAAYNGAALIEETLASITAQTLRAFEVIVVDDCSTDTTREVVAAYPDPRVRLIALDTNAGPVRARNRAVAEARGRYIAALDQDDLCLPSRFAEQVAWLDAHRDVALLGTQVDLLRAGVVRPSSYAVTSTPTLIAYLIGIENPLAWSSVMVRTSAAQALDPFTRPDLLYAEDFDLYHRIGPVGGVARLDAPLLRYRQHEGGASRRYTATMRASAARVLAEAHRGLFGADHAGLVASTLVAHNMGGDPVPDRATLALLGEALAAIQADFVARENPDAESLRLIRWETAQRWGRIGRAGLRAGTLTVTDVAAVRPDHLGMGYAGLDALGWSGAIGTLRRRAG